MTVLFLFGQILVLHRLNTSKLEKYKNFEQKVEPLFWQLMAEEIHQGYFIARISSRDFDMWQKFLTLYAESLAGESLEKIKAVARLSGLTKHLLVIAENRQDWEYAKAVYFLGLIKEPEVLPFLVYGLHAENIILFFPAAIALARNGLAGIKTLLSLLEQRQEWTELLGVSILAEFGPEVCAVLLQELESGVLSRRLELLALDLLAHFTYREAEQFINRKIKEEVSPEMLIRLLRIWKALGLGWREELYPILRHSAWEVRTAAALALNGSSLAENAERIISELTRLLRDASWWVRYRAAQTLLNLGARETLIEFQNNPLEDLYAREMIKYVLDTDGGATCVLPNTNVL